MLQWTKENDTSLEQYA